MLLNQLLENVFIWSKIYTMSLTLSQLKTRAISRSLFAPTSLAHAFSAMGFVQADPIKSPARAQDLILRHRVSGYYLHDLEKYYADLEIEEDFLYAYGFITRDLHSHLYPRKTDAHSLFEKKILKFVQESQTPIDCRELENLFGKERTINAWGGFSKATKIALENLHFSGNLRIVGREKGRRIYQSATRTQVSIPVEIRLRSLVLAVLTLLEPVSERTLQEALSRIRRHVGDTKIVIKDLIQSGEVEKHIIDGQSYLLLATAPKELDHLGVKFLAPFDPLIWDRRRFEHLWGWAYRFEAYTPVQKRVRGYYAMPVLWQETIIGWVNLHVSGNTLYVDIGYVGKPITDTKFKNELASEIESMKNFLGCQEIEIR